jgi:hypothetical protein
VSDVGDDSRDAGAVAIRGGRGRFQGPSRKGIECGVFAQFIDSCGRVDSTVT